MKKLTTIVAVTLAITTLAAPSMAAGKGKPSATPSASTPAPKSTASSRRIQITVTGTVKATWTPSDASVSVTLKTVPQGKNKIDAKKGSDITVVAAGTGFALKRNDLQVSPAVLSALKPGDKVTLKLISVSPSGSLQYTAQWINATGV